MERDCQAGEAGEVTRRHPAAVGEGAAEEGVRCGANHRHAVVGDEEVAALEVDEQAEVANARGGLPLAFFEVALEAMCCEDGRHAIALCEDV